MVEDPAPAFRVAPLPRGGHSSYLHLGHDVAAMLLDKYSDRPYSDTHLPARLPHMVRLRSLPLWPRTAYLPSREE